MFIAYLIIGIIVLGLALTVLFYIIESIADIYEFLGAEFLFVIGFGITFLIASFYFGRWLLHVLT